LWCATAALFCAVPTCTMPTTTELAAERGFNRGDPVVFRSTSLDTLSGASSLTPPPAQMRDALHQALSTKLAVAVWLMTHHDSCDLCELQKWAIRGGKTSTATTVEMSCDATRKFSACKYDSHATSCVAIKLCASTNTPRIIAASVCACPRT
jgi:hypothetical protein